MTVSRTSAVLGRRACAALAATSAVLHAAMIGRGFAAVLTVAMAAACLYCAYELWTGGSVRAWLGVAVMNLVMIGAHLSAPGHHHRAVVQATAPSTLMTAATGLAVVEALIAAAVLYRLTAISARNSGFRPEKRAEITG